MPYIFIMQTVITTPMFLKQAARCGLDEGGISDIVSAIADDPQGGDLMSGTGGARKMRHAGRGQGKSGGYRTVHYFGGGDIPVFLLAIFGKGAKGNLTKSERNDLAALLPRLGDTYRANVKRSLEK